MNKDELDIIKKVIEEEGMRRDIGLLIDQNIPVAAKPWWKTVQGKWMLGLGVLIIGIGAAYILMPSESDQTLTKEEIIAENIKPESENYISENENIEIATEQSVVTIDNSKTTANVPTQKQGNENKPLLSKLNKGYEMDTRSSSVTQSAVVTSNSSFNPDKKEETILAVKSYKNDDEVVSPTKTYAGDEDLANASIKDDKDLPNTETPESTTEDRTTANDENVASGNEVNDKNNDAEKASLYTQDTASDEQWDVADENDGNDENNKKSNTNNVIDKTEGKYIFDISVGAGYSFLSTGDIRAVPVEIGGGMTIGRLLAVQLNGYYGRGTSLGIGEEAKYWQGGAQLFYSPFGNQGTNDFRVGVGPTYYQTDRTFLTSSTIINGREIREYDSEIVASPGISFIIEDRVKVAEVFFIGGGVYMHRFINGDIVSGAKLNVGYKFNQ